MYFSLCSFTVRPFRIQIFVNHHHSNSLLPSPTETLSIFSFSHLNPSLRYPSTLIYQWFIPLKPSILPVWVSVCYKHAFIHKPQLPKHFLLGLLLTLHRRERASTTHCLSKNNLSLPTNHHHPAIPVIAAQGPRGRSQTWLTGRVENSSLLWFWLNVFWVRVWWEVWMWLFRVGGAAPLLSIHVNAFFPFGKRQRCEPEVP